MNIESTEEDDNYNASIVRHMKVALLFPQLTLQHLMKEGIGRIPTGQHESSRILWCLVPIEYPQSLQLDTSQTWCVPTKKAAHLQTMINTPSALVTFSHENINNKFETSLCQPWIVYNQIFCANHATTILTVDRRDKTVCVLAIIIVDFVHKDVIPNRLGLTFAKSILPWILDE